MKSINNKLIIIYHHLIKNEIMSYDISGKNNRKLQENLKNFEKKIPKVENRKIRTFKEVSPEHKAAYIQKIRRQSYYQKVLLFFIILIIIRLAVWLVNWFLEGF